MAASHRETFTPPGDALYDNERAATRRRRFHSELRLPPGRFPGDGLDLRRPVMSTSAAPRNHRHANVDGREAHTAAVIDLTNADAATEHSSEHSEPLPAPQMSTRATRLPRMARNVIDIESSGDEAGEDITEYPGADYLALPRHRLQYAAPRRPARLPSPPPDMDEIQFIEERPRLHPVAGHASASLPASPQPQRSATPHPTGVGEPIDLTGDNDDEIVHLNTRQREGVNNEPPHPAAATVPRTFADRGYDHMGHIANLLREGGANLGGRLYQRIQEFAGREEPRYGGAGLRGLEEPRGEPLGLRLHRAEDARRRHHHHHHHHLHQHHHHHRRTEGGLHRAANRTAIRIMQEMPDMMQYDMTGFDLGMGHARNHPPRPPSPKYEPPSAAEKGFTRAPAADEIVVCPNCGDELAVGDEGPKQEIWVVKGCGHAYCGECAQNRSRPVSKKGKGKAKVLDDGTLPPPFKKCVIEGCGKPAAPKSMVLVYLGS